MRNCIYCGNVPHVLDMGGLFYVQCKCGNFNPNEFCGAHPKNAIAVWDDANSVGAKSNMERMRKVKRAQGGDYVYIVDGAQRYESAMQVAEALHCSKSTITSKFGKLVNSAIVFDHLILRVKKAKGGKK